MSIVCTPGHYCRLRFIIDGRERAVSECKLGLRVGDTWFLPIGEGFFNDTKTCRPLLKKAHGGIPFFIARMQLDICFSDLADAERRSLYEERNIHVRGCLLPLDHKGECSPIRPGRPTREDMRERGRQAYERLKRTR